MERCKCGAMVEVTDTSWRARDRTKIIGCKACGWTGNPRANTKPEKSNMAKDRNGIDIDENGNVTRVVCPASHAGKAQLTPAATGNYYQCRGCLTFLTAAEVKKEIDAAIAIARG